MAETVQYEVPGTIPEFAQPSDMSCWITVVTMLLSWRDGVSYSIDSVLDMLGSDFRQIYESDEGLGGERMQDLTNAAGLTYESQRCETPQSINDLLQTYGPLIIIADEDPTIRFCVHARIIKGIDGDGEPDGTDLTILDPGPGSSYQELFSEFAAKYEEMAGLEEYTIQMMHL
jgi:hypothetical protein